MAARVLEVSDETSKREFPTIRSLPGSIQARTLTGRRRACHGLTVGNKIFGPPDLNLPFQAGFQFCQEIHQNHPDIPFLLAFSAAGLPDSRGRVRGIETRSKHFLSDLMMMAGLLTACIHHPIAANTPLMSIWVFQCPRLLCKAAWLLALPIHQSGEIIASASRLPRPTDVLDALTAERRY